MRGSESGTEAWLVVAREPDPGYLAEMFPVAGGRTLAAMDCPEVDLGRLVQSDFRLP